MTSKQNTIREKYKDKKLSFYENKLPSSTQQLNQNNEHINMTSASILLTAIVATNSLSQSAAILDSHKVNYHKTAAPIEFNKDQYLAESNIINKLSRLELAVTLHRQRAML